MTDDLTLEDVLDITGTAFATIAAALGLLAFVSACFDVAGWQIAAYSSTRVFAAGGAIFVLLTALVEAVFRKVLL